MRAKTLKEGIENFLDDPASAKAIAGWKRLAGIGEDDPEEYTLEIQLSEPLRITIEERDKGSFKFLFNKYRIPYEILEEVEVDEGLNEKLRFSDGVEFDTQGPLRPEQRFDGWYVVGRGMLIPVDSEQDAIDTIERLEQRRGED